MLQFQKELGRESAHGGDAAENKQRKPRQTGTCYDTKQFYRKASGNALTPASEMLVFQHRVHIAALFPAAQRAGRREQICEALENAFHKHIFEYTLILHAKAPAELLHSPVRLQADGKFFVVVFGDEALALVHDVDIAAVRQHREALQLFKTVIDK